MHDHNPGFLRRTTNGKKKFPGKNQSTDFTWEELQSLNAGEWFLKVRDVQKSSQHGLCLIAENHMTQEVLSDFPEGSFPLCV